MANRPARTRLVPPGCLPGAPGRGLGQRPAGRPVGVPVRGRAGVPGQRPGVPRGPSPVQPVGLGQVDGDPVVFSGNWDRVSLWDARTGQLWHWLEGHMGKVRSVGLGEIDDDPVIVSVRADAPAPGLAVDKFASSTGAGIPGFEMNG